MIFAGLPTFLNVVFSMTFISEDTLKFIIIKSDIKPKNHFKLIFCLGFLTEPTFEIKNSYKVIEEYINNDQ